MRAVGIVAVATILGSLLTACGDGGGNGNGTTTSNAPPTTSSSASSTPTLDRAAAEAEIKRNWAAFFSKSTPVAKKLDYLEDGQELQAAVQRFGTDPRTQQATAVVTGVFVGSSTAATVNYRVLLGSTVALPNAIGTAVQQDGVWKVSRATLCGLLGLMGTTGAIAGC